MKITTIERTYTTTIDADARELRECNTVSDNFTRLLSRAFQSREPFEDYEDDEGDEEDQDATS